MKSCYQLIITVTISEKKQIHLEQTYAVETLSQIKDFFILEIPHFFFFFFLQDK